MPILDTQNDFRRVQRLPFCYLCGASFLEDDITDGDHVPPRSAFNSRDREPALKLRTHKKCNASNSVDDKKVGQLIALRRREAAPSLRDQALRFVTTSGMVGLTNLNVDAAVWRWVRGFHAALSPSHSSMRAILFGRRFQGRMTLVANMCRSPCWNNTN